MEKHQENAVVIASTARQKKYRYSEIFYSIQGEGQYTGINSAWLRLWGCNFRCAKFGYDSKDPSTWEDKWAKIDLTDITTLEQLPVIDKSCDTQYSWDKRFRHLSHLETPVVICDLIEQEITNKYNPEGKFVHATSGQDIHMAFTGGEPLMNQRALVSILSEFETRGNKPKFVTIETNGTQALKPELFNKIQGIEEELVEKETRFKEWFWSVSPKLSASGEDFNKAVLPDVVKGYKYASNHGQLKYVVDGSKECWDEVEKATALYRKVGIMWPVYIMPEGATTERQERHAGEIAKQAMARGYYVSARVHTNLFGNVIGT